MSFNQEIVNDALADLRQARELKRANQAALKLNDLHVHTRHQCGQAIEAANKKSFAAKVALTQQLEALKTQLHDAEEESLLCEGSDLELELSILNIKNLLLNIETQLENERSI